MNKKIITVLILLLLAISSSAYSGTIFAQKQYDRSSGAPNSYSDSFIACDTDKGASYLLIIENGDAAGFNRLSSAKIVLNGADVVTPNDLNQKVGRVEKPVQLLPENNLSVNLSSGPGGFLKVSVVCISGCLEVKINSPYDNASINKPATLVTGGLLNTYGETGVTIKTAFAEKAYAEVAQSRGNEFAAVMRRLAEDANTIVAQSRGYAFAGLAHLAAGANTITAIAVNTCGYSVSDTIMINAAPSASGYVSLSVTPSTGVPDSVTGALSVSLDGMANVKNIASYSYEYNGDNIIDATAADLSSVTVDYSMPGLYYPTIVVTDTAGNQFTDTVVVNVMTKAELDAMLIPKWNVMKSSLASGNVEGALKYFTGKAQKKYRYNFNMLLPHLPEIVAGYGPISFVKISGAKVEYEMNAVQGGETNNYGVYFIQDADGIWRIKSF